MARTRHYSQTSHDRWLVSYADFITLLFAFFVVMFASTQTDKAHAKAVSDAIKRALRDGSGAPRIGAILGGSPDNIGRGNGMLHGPGGYRIPKPPTAAELAEKEAVPAKEHETEKDPLKTPMQVLNETLKDELSAGNIHLELQARGLVIGLQTAAFFPSGGDQVAPALYSTVAKVAVVLNKVPNALRLEGHTDSVPISTPRFQSNWELSAARSIAMMRLLSDKFGISSQRMAIVGYADNAAVDTNETEQGRERNRRVDIVIVSDLGMRTEPPQASSNQNSGKPQMPKENEQDKTEAKNARTS